MMKLILLVCAVASASASHLAVPKMKPKVQSPATEKVLALRGGSDATNAIMLGSGALWTLTGASMYLGTEQITNLLWLGLNKFPHDSVHAQYIGIAMLGWGFGRLAAFKAGAEAMKSV